MHIQNSPKKAICESGSSRDAEDLLGFFFGGFYSFIKESEKARKAPDEV